MKPMPQNESEVVYRRPLSPDTPPPVIQTTEPQTTRLAPTLTPIAIGFLLLLGLISALGLLSTNRMERVSFDAQTKVTQNSTNKSILLNVRLAVTKLDNEARVESAAESQRIKPPLDLRFHGARDDVRTQLAVLERPPLSEKAEWRQLHDDIQSFLAITDDLRRYSLDGFEKFRAISAELNVISAILSKEQDKIFIEVQDLQGEARRSIRLWSVIALIAGALVAAGTVWEVQRKFKQTRRSMFEARRERTFTNQLLEGMVSAVAAVDNEDRIRSANAAFFTIFPHATVGASVLEPLGPNDAMKMLEAATATQVDRASYRGRWAVKLDKEEKSFDVYSSPLAIDGQRGQILTLVDATEVAESERVLRRG